MADTNTSTIIEGPAFYWGRVSSTTGFRYSKSVALMIVEQAPGLDVILQHHEYSDGLVLGKVKSAKHRPIHRDVYLEVEMTYDDPKIIALANTDSFALSLALDLYGRAPSEKTQQIFKDDVRKIDHAVAFLKVS